MVDNNVETSLGKLTTVPARKKDDTGPGTGRGIQDPTGGMKPAGAGDKVDGDSLVPADQKPVDGKPVYDDSRLTTEEINRVIVFRARLFRACYTKELARDPKLQGRLVIRFKISGTGAVQSAAVAQSTIKSPAVESCVKGQLMKLKFHAKGAVAEVSYPFVFSQGG
jgi:hypothetical protein